MENVIAKTEEFLKLMGFEEVKVTLDEERRKISIFIEDGYIENQIPIIVPALDHVLNLIFKKVEIPRYTIDLNYYRKEREGLILELTKAAARKASMTKTAVELPPMNAYERRLVHLEIASHPELKTESAGLDKERHIVIKLVE